MADIIGLIQNVEDDSYDGKAFKKVTINGIVYRVKQGKEGALMAKWGLLVMGTAVKLTMKDFMKEGKAYPFVHDIETVAGALPPATSSVVAPPQPPPRPEINGQALGMMTKEIGDMIRADKLEIVFGAVNAALIAKWYRGQVSFVTGLPVEGVSQ